MMAGVGICQNVAGLTVTWVHTETGLQQLGPEWMDLFRRVGCENVFLSFDWMVEWWAEWGAQRRLFVVTVRDPTGRLTALVPLCITPSAVGRMGPCSLGFLASERVGSDHLDILVEPGSEAAAIRATVHLVAAYRSEWDYIELSDSDSSSPLLLQLRQQLKILGMSEYVVRASECPYITLPSSFEHYLTGLGPSVRYNFRRRVRNLEHEGSVHFIVLQGDVELERHFADLVRLHCLRFERRNRESSFLEPTVQAFHAAVLPQLAARGWPRLYLLQVREVVVAALYGFSIGKKFLFYQSGMDPAWSRHSVGLVMMGRAIEEAIRGGHREFDFLRGEEPYKFQWTKQTRQTLTVRLFDRRPKSQWALAKVRLVEYAARAKAMLRRWMATTRPASRHLG